MSMTQITLGEMTGGYSHITNDYIKTCPSQGIISDIGMTGIKPKILFVTFLVNSSTVVECYYNENVSTTTYYRVFYWQGTRYEIPNEAFADDPSISGLASIDVNGFKLSPSSTASSAFSDICYLAIA